MLVFRLDAGHFSGSLVCFGALELVPLVWAVLEIVYLRNWTLDKL